MRTYFSIFCFSVAGLSVGACKPKEAPKQESSEPSVSATASTAVSSMAPSVAQPSASADLPKLAPSIEDWPSSVPPNPLPMARIKAPLADAIVPTDKAKDFEVLLDVKNWELAQGKEHVHLILDNHPYKPIYDASKPVKISELLPPNVQLTEGQHLLTTFPSRPTHESVKEKGAASFVTFWVGKKGTPTIDIKKPHLIYSRPKGDNPGRMGRHLLIDFYLHNTQLDQGEKVRFFLTGSTLEHPIEGTFEKWAPKVVHHLPQGDYELKLELVDKTGARIEGPFNTTTRKITVSPHARMDPALGVPLGPLGHGDHRGPREHRKHREHP